MENWRSVSRDRLTMTREAWGSAYNYVRDLASSKYDYLHPSSYRPGAYFDLLLKERANVKKLLAEVAHEVTQSRNKTRRMVGGTFQRFIFNVGQKVGAKDLTEQRMTLIKKLGIKDDSEEEPDASIPTLRIKFRLLNAVIEGARVWHDAADARYYFSKLTEQDVKRISDEIASEEFP